MYHFMNGYEKDGQVLIDYVEHPRDEKGISSGPPTLHPITADPLKGTATNHALDDRTVEFPRSDLVLLDPDHFDEEPLAIVHLPLRVPNGLHGNWLEAVS
jgi:carotenoid cleavage dioxygenase-like enzyme